MRTMSARLQRILSTVLLATSTISACGTVESRPDLPIIPAPTIALAPVESTVVDAHEALQADLSDIDWEGLGEIIAAEDQRKIIEARSTYGKCGEYHDLALAVGWTEEEWPTLSRIMFRESRCEPDACSKSDSNLKCRDAGLVQINQIHRDWLSEMGFAFPDDLFDPMNNLLFARRLYETSGWKPWAWLGQP